MLDALLNQLGGGVAGVTSAGRVQIGLAAAVGPAGDEAGCLSTSSRAPVAASSRCLRLHSVGTVVLLRHFSLLVLFTKLNIIYEELFYYDFKILVQIII